MQRTASVTFNKATHLGKQSMDLVDYAEDDDNEEEETETAWATSPPQRRQRPMTNKAGNKEEEVLSNSRTTIMARPIQKEE
jgi:hypothetical protein